MHKRWLGGCRVLTPVRRNKSLSCVSAVGREKEVERERSEDPRGHQCRRRPKHKSHGEQRGLGRADIGRRGQGLQLQSLADEENDTLNRPDGAFQGRGTGAFALGVLSLRCRLHT